MTPAAAPNEAREHIDRVHELLAESEQNYDRDGLPLIGGANLMSAGVRRALASSLNSRPRVRSLAERLAGPRDAADEVEVIAKALLARLFNAQFAEVRVLSGSLANLHVYMTLAEPGDVVMGLPKVNGGHFSHNSQGAAGMYRLVTEPIPCHPGTQLIDYESLARDMDRLHPRLVIVGSSLPLVSFDVPRLATMAHGVGATLIYDAAHVAGLIAGGRFQDPLAEGADLVTISTYKTLNGPAGGAILTNDPDIAERLDRVVSPGLTANFDMARVAGLAVACAELLEFGREYAGDCIENAMQLAGALVEQGISVWSPDGGASFTASHIMAIDTQEWPETRERVRNAHACNIFTSPVPLPEKPKGGIRIGVHQLTRLGMHVTEMKKVAHLIAAGLREPSRSDSIRREVRLFRANFQHIGYSLD